MYHEYPDAFSIGVGDLYGASFSRGRDRRRNTVGEMLSRKKPGTRFFGGIHARAGNNVGPGSIVADAMLRATGYTGVQAALISGWEIRSNLLPGPITVETVKRLMLNTPLVRVYVSGGELKTFIEQTANRRPGHVSDAPGAHVAGIRFSFDRNATGGEKVTGLEIGSVTKGYRRCGDDEHFLLVTTAFSVAELIAFRGHCFMSRVANTHRTLHDVFGQYLYSVRKPLVHCPENRINIARPKVMVFSDPHYFDPSLLIADGPAFQAYIAQDRKMIAESHAILLATAGMIRAARPDICLVPGDLTKDGELLSHTGVNRILTDSLLSAGIRVYVAPGNHDINNPEAYSYNGDAVTAVPSVDADEFASLFDDMGYGDAIERDTGSLTYIAEPENGLWILSIDDCKYRDNAGHSQTGGALSETTLQWILGKLGYARENNITVLGMMHHGVTEHYAGQTQIMGGMFRDYVVDEWTWLRDTLAAHGLHVVFTGHYHAQDIVKREAGDGSFLFDIETGSTVTWPCPVRSVELHPSRLLDVTTSLIESIDYPLPVVSFQEFARTFLVEGLTGTIDYLLTIQFGVPAREAQELAPVITNALAAHYHGDEQPGPVDIATYEQLKSSPDPLTASMGVALESLWTDLQPADNDCSIDLTDGTVR